ncbi:restriction endonuclease [Desulfofustis glycolicus]|uniref:Restriction system protein n=1 Tax=Desulfofustis glycolicus DSM 9705 TaxID=1121409 RepID=A0A1M5TAG1_9BACT|nr:restriction endonuclease [Desulfofustis glycolicus]SHH47767.1 restriction system protein [Desulfofustis glycolicus DSM 9705]
MKKNDGPEFLRFFGPIVIALKEKGGSGTSAEITDRAIELLDISEEEQKIELPSGGTRVRNQVQFARAYLKEANVIGDSQRGVWTLTDIGLNIDPSKYDFRSLYKKAVKSFSDKNKQKKCDKKNITTLGDDEKLTCRNVLLQKLKSLSPDGFERLCQRLLRESGFDQVKVTGRSGDGGIDGIGILQVNPFVSFNVLFQCKKYSGSVTASQVRDFRGAMSGRADKGILITTGSFTVSSKSEARRDGVPPIELVDGEDLVKLFEDLELGLIPRKVYDIDEAFFEQYE